MNNFILAALIAAVPVWGQSARAKRQELREVQRQLELKKREISEFKKQTEQMRQDLSKLASETSGSRRKIRAMEDKIHEAETRKAELKQRLTALRLAEDQWQGLVTDEVRAYQRRLWSRSEFYGGQELWEESFRRAAILEKLRYVSELHGVKRVTEVAEAEALRRRVDLLAKTEKAKAEHLTRESLYRQKKESLEETKQRLQETQKALNELQESALALTHLIRTLDRSSPYKPKGVVIPLAEMRNSLPWPVEGTVIGTFGRHTVPELKTVVVHQGIQFATAASAPVHPVKAGKVIFAGPFRSYGQVMIVDHGQAFYSIYGRLGEMRKGKGDSIRPDEILATVGPAQNGGTLYFEIRQSGDALDPMDWLQKR